MAALNPARTRPHLSWQASGVYALMVVVSFLLLFPIYPIYWMMTISLKMPKEIYRVPSLVPHTLTLGNYRTLIGKKHFLTNIKNSLIVATAVTVIAVVISAFAAYSLVRFRYRVHDVACTATARRPAWRRRRRTGPRS